MHGKHFVSNGGIGRCAVMTRQHCDVNPTSESMQFIAEERQWHPNMSSFWNKFSNGNGKRISYRHILDVLAKDHSENPTQDAANMHFFFGGNLGRPDSKEAFSYMKTGKMFLSLKDDVITRKWIKLLKDELNISSCWAVQNTAPHLAPASGPLP